MLNCLPLCMTGLFILDETITMHDLKNFRSPKMSPANARPPEWFCGLAVFTLAAVAGAVFMVFLTGGF